MQTDRGIYHKRVCDRCGAVLGGRMMNPDEYFKESNPWFFIAAGNYLIVGLIAEDGQKTIYVARQYYEIVNIPGEGWLRESDAENLF